MKKSSKLRAIITLLIIACFMLTLFACSIEKVEDEKPTSSSQVTSSVDTNSSTNGGNSSTDEPTSSSSKGELTSSSSEETSSSKSEPTSSSKDENSSSNGGSDVDPTPSTDYENIEVPNGYKEFKSFINVQDKYTANGMPDKEIVDGIWTIQTDADFRTRKRSWAKTGYTGFDYVDARKMLDGKTSYDFTHSFKLANGKGLKVNVPGKGYLVLYVSNGSGTVTDGKQKLTVNGVEYAFPASGSSDPVVQVVVAVDKGEYVVGRHSGTVDLYFAELHCVEPSGSTVDPTPDPNPTPTTKYTFTFEENGGEAVEDITAEKLTELPTTTREGYKFLGWFDNADLNGEAIIVPYTSNKDITLYAKWEKTTVDPSPTEETKAYIDIGDYSANVGTTSSEIVSGVWTISSGLEIRKRARSWEKTGYSGFDYIDTRTSLDGKTKLSFTYSIKLASADNGLKVNAPGKGYLVLYVQNGSTTAKTQELQVNNNKYDILVSGDPVIQVVVAVDKGEYLISTANKTIDLYYAELQCSGSGSIDPTPTPTTKYTFTFEENGGEAVDDITAEKLTELPTPIREGYKFLGWFDNADLIGNAITVPYTANKDITLYAKWEAVVIDTNYLVESKGLSETAYVVWKDSKASSAKAYYKKSSDTNYTAVDSELIRNIGNGQARVDILGLAAGTYDIKITVGADGGIAKALAADNVCIRIIGRVATDTRTSASSWEGKYTQINGLKDEGSSGKEGSLWGLLEIQNHKNITLEGVGSDAELYQWGVSFKRCNSVEVRNLTFTNYPEDACEFNGGSNSDMPKYGNCWVHNNTFNQGMRLFDDSAEKDKGEGDGAIDMKYCHNMTYSYNKVANCHKTGLIGGSDSHEQKNITFHHNYFYKNSSRMPLGRQANMHYYNNYYESITGTCMSIRGNGYVFAESNYLNNCSNPFEIKQGAIKSYNNVLKGCSGTNNATVVTDRTKTVSNSCQFGSAFDIDANGFYYDSTNKVSKVRYLTSAEQAKTDCLELAGPGKANK